MPDPIRLAIADVLDAIAAAERWDDELYKKFRELLERAEEDDLLAYADHELIHYCNECHSSSLLGIRAKPNRAAVYAYCDTFRDIARCVREDGSWEHYKISNNIVETASDLKEWAKKPDTLNDVLRLIGAFIGWLVIGALLAFLIGWAIVYVARWLNG